MQLTRLFDHRGALVHDDRVDCLASAIAFWENSLALDVDQIILRRQKQETDKISKDWLNDDRRMGLFSERLGSIMTNKQPDNNPINKWAGNRYWNK